MLKLFLLTNQVFNLPKQISNLKVHLSLLIIKLDNLVWTTISMSRRELGKEELNLTMELTGGQFVMIFSTWLKQMFFADHSIQDLEPSAGQVLETCHTLKRKDFLMDFKNQFWWMMFHAQEMKITLANASIDLSATAVTQKTSLSLAQEHLITPLTETIDWRIHKIWPTTMVLYIVFGEELKYSTELIGIKFVTMTLPWATQE